MVRFGAIRRSSILWLYQSQECCRDPQMYGCPEHTVSWIEPRVFRGNRALKLRKVIWALVMWNINSFPEKRVTCLDHALTHKVTWFDSYFVKYFQFPEFRRQCPPLIVKSSQNPGKSFPLWLLEDSRIQVKFSLLIVQLSYTSAWKCSTIKSQLPQISTNGSWSWAPSPRLHPFRQWNPHRVLFRNWF